MPLRNPTHGHGDGPPTSTPFVRGGGGGKGGSVAAADCESATAGPGAAPWSCSSAARNVNRVSSSPERLSAAESADPIEGETAATEFDAVLSPRVRSRPASGGGGGAPFRVRCRSVG